MEIIVGICHKITKGTLAFSRSINTSNATGADLADAPNVVHRSSELSTQRICDIRPRFLIHRFRRCVADDGLSHEYIFHGCLSSISLFPFELQACKRADVQAVVSETFATERFLFFRSLSFRWSTFLR